MAPIEHSTLRTQYLLDKEIVFLNHGSFGATPRKVFETYQNYQRQLERQPVQFLKQELSGLLKASRAELAAFLRCGDDEVVFVPNPTFAANTVARSLELNSDDEFLTTNHEYGACLFAFRFASQKRHFRIIEQPVELPNESTTSVEIADRFWSAVTPKTKVILVSHITSPTALTMPVGEICRRAREANILTIVDGAHAPGQVDLDLSTIDADFYTGACHKWLSAPKGVSFLYARRDKQHLLQPLVIGWGWGKDRLIKVGSDFLDAHEWLGTRDPAAYLSVPAAIQFQRKNNWQNVRAECRNLVRSAVRQATRITQVEPACNAEFHQQMGLVELPLETDLPSLKQRLLEIHRIEIPVIDWNNRKFLRISVQGYNSPSDIEAFLVGLEKELG